MSSDGGTMADGVVIRFENVSKRYKRTFGGLRHLVQDTANRLLGRYDGGPPEERYLWALENVSFEAHRGELLGIIGPNGSGKSTILKLISRITHPTLGKVEVKGKAGGLIEMGAGFDQELTGRENIFLNGSIIGMSWREIEAKYERIVDFAELDGFMDMPVKRYSSGMWGRLAFAVAAHLEPDIFLIDEALAVGDERFQAKCVNKIHELKERETTIIFVTHNLRNIARHSDRALWMEGGKVRAVGEPDDVITSYLESVKVKG